MGEDKTPDWIAIRAHYESGADTLPVICETHAITISQLRYRAKTRGWTPRLRRPRDRGRLIERMLKLVARQVKQFEAAEAGSAETEARLLASLARTLDKLIRLEAAERRDGEEQTDAAQGAEAYGDLRERLANRIRSLAGGEG